MALTLKIVSFKGRSVPQTNAVSIGTEGGSVGRSDDNTLVLADPERLVSRHHARISVKNGLYYLTDSSLSGVFIAGQEQPLHNNSQQIFDGDLLKIGEYEVAVSIVEAAQAADFPFSSPDSLVNPDFPPAGAMAAASLLTDPSSTSVNHNDLFKSNDNSFSPAFTSKLKGNQSPLFDNYIPPRVDRTGRAVEEIPENLSFEDLLGDAASVDKFVPAATSTPASPATAPVTAGDVAFSAFLQGAGINAVEIQPEQLKETMLRAGQMFRKLVDGTVALLRSRAEFKSLFRMNMTVIKTANNNPLKFTVSSDDVLRQLLENKSGGFLDSTAAIEEGFSDIMNHQLAMQAGIQASLADLLRSFDPAFIEKEFEQGLVLQKKSKCWDKFSETYQITVDNAVENFFGDAFIEAYEAQMHALTAGRNRK